MAHQFTENNYAIHNTVCLCYDCRQHKEEVPGDIFDMLLTFTDFMAFKEMFLEYRAVSCPEACKIFKPCFAENSSTI